MCETSRREGSRFPPWIGQFLDRINPDYYNLALDRSVYLCVSVCVLLFVCVRVHVCVYVCVCVFMFVYVCMFVIK